MLTQHVMNFYMVRTRKKFQVSGLHLNSYKHEYAIYVFNYIMRDTILSECCRYYYDTNTLYRANGRYVRWGKLYGALGLCMTEQLLLVISYDEVVKYTYINTTSVE